jgi:hypothetical protein
MNDITMAFISGEIYDEVTRFFPSATQASATYLCKKVGIYEIVISC